MIRNLAKIGLQGGARQGELFGDAGVFFGGLDQIPARMSVRMAMKLDDTIIAHGLDFAPAQYNLVATPLLDPRFAVAMRRRFRQLVLPQTMPPRAVAHPCGPQETHGGIAGFFSQGVGESRQYVG